MNKKEEKKNTNLKIEMLSTDLLTQSECNPYKVLDDEAMAELVESIYQFNLSFTFASEMLEEYSRKISLLLSTPVGTMPLDREFGVDMDFLDMPSETAKSLYVAEITEKIARFIPELRVESVSWVASPAGTLIPKVVITNGGD